MSILNNMHKLLPGKHAKRGYCHRQPTDSGRGPGWRAMTNAEHLARFGKKELTGRQIAMQQGII